MGTQPDRIGRYAVERLLGSGAFATVWLARDEALDAWVAIKVLAENWVHHDDVRRRFTEEARILWRLDSDRILRVHTVDVLDDGRPYFVMDYADAGTLAERMGAHLDRGERYEVGEAVALSIGIAESLGVAHAAGIVHRDLKPSNVLFRRLESGGERMVLADFGIARSLEAARSTTISAGTPHYMAPEQTEGRAGRGSDVYGAAVILYELLAGSVPFPFTSAGQVMRAQLTQAAPDIRTVRPEVPALLAAVVARGLEGDPAMRYPTAEAWRDALAGAIGQSVEGAVPLAAATTPGDPGATLGPEDIAAAQAMAAGAGAGRAPQVPPAAHGGAPPSFPPPHPSGPPPGPPAGGRGRNRRRRRRLVAGLVILALGASVGAIAAVSSGTSSGADVLRIPAPASGPNSWMGSIVPASAAIPAVTLPPLPSTPSNPALPSTALPLPSAPTNPALPTTTVAASGSAVVTVAGTTPGLYGGTRQLSVCDVGQMISFLASHLDKAKAWADAQGITVADIPTFVAGLTNVILRADTRVTNHGFVNGKANAIQSLLEAGTAVLVDPLGMPRVKCTCGNPLLAPVVPRSAPKYTGDVWPAFSPGRVVVVTPAAVTQTIVLVDVRTGVPFQRRVGTAGTSDSDAPAGLAIYVPPGGAGAAGPAPTSTTPPTTPAPTTLAPTTAAPTTAAPTTAPPTTAAPIADITKLGTVSASSVFSSEFPTSLARDGNPGTSWFSAGDADGPTSTFTWQAPGNYYISRVSLLGNSQNANPAFRKGFGYGSTELQVLDASGAIVYDQSFAGPNDSVLSVVATPNVVGRTVRAVFKQRQNSTCGGIAEYAAAGRPA